MTTSLPPRYHVVISSGDVQSPAIAVRGALYGTGSATVEIIDGVTPLDVRIDGPIISGMTQSVDASRRIHVEVRQSYEAESRPIMVARARTILFGNVGRNRGLSIRGAP